MQTYFYQLADELTKNLTRDEVFLASLYGEETSFCRFNRGKIRQCGQVVQNGVELSLISRQKQTSSFFELTGNISEDLKMMSGVLDDLRDTLSQAEVDPYLLFATSVVNTENLGENLLPTSKEIVNDILSVTAKQDFVGILAAGKILRGFANSLGQRNFFSTSISNCDYSVYLHTDKAIKQSYAGFTWSNKEFKELFEEGVDQLEYLKLSPVGVKPGSYRVYFSPAAVSEILGLLSYGSFGIESIRTKRSPLRRLAEGEVKLSPSVNLQENYEIGTVQPFDSTGFIRPSHIQLIKDGKFESPLVSPRSAKEFSKETTASGESPESLDLAQGEISKSEVISRLDTGVYINNLWYTNFSDKNSCRITGMTRFASFWVENGKIKGPLNVMRFDDSFFDMFGKNLIGLTQGRELILESSTYYQRNTGSTRLPGALIEDFKFTL